MTMTLAFRILLIGLLAFTQRDVPLKPFSDFSVEVNYSFKERPVNANAPAYSAERSHQGDPLPFLALKVKILKASPEEVRVRGVNSAKKILFSRKLELNEVINVEMGFMEDIKERIPEASHEINIYTLTSKKVEVFKIHIVVAEDGAFMVNGERRGTF